MATLTAAEFYQISNTQLLSLGAKYSDALGRSWRYALAGAQTLAAGKLNIEATEIANHQGRSFTTIPAVGATVVNVTVGATAVEANYYRGGTLTVVSGTGLAQSYGIASNSAVSSAGGTCVITLTEAIRIAGATGQSNVDLCASPYSNIIVSIADQLDIAVGVAPVAITNAFYGFIQTGGQGAVLVDEIIAKGQACTIGSSTVGAIEAADAAGEQIVCTMGPKTAVDTEYENVLFCLDTPDR